MRSFCRGNGLPTAENPISTTDRKKRIFYNTLEVLDFVLNTNHRISIANYDNKYFMAFNLTSTQELSHGFIHPELTNCIISVELKFEANLGNNVELIFKGERASTVLCVQIEKLPQRSNNLSWPCINFKQWNLVTVVNI